MFGAVSIHPCCAGGNRKRFNRGEDGSIYAQLPSHDVAGFGRLLRLKLANRGVDTRSLQHYLGHKNIQHTVRYTELSPQRFRDFWKD